MINSKWIVRLAAIAALTAGCSSNGTKTNDGAQATETTVTLQGTVAQELRSADLQAVAIGKDGRTFWTRLDAAGDFRLAVPSGQSYRLVLAKAKTIVAELTVEGTLGRARWIRGEAGTLRLGQVRLPGATTPASSGLKTASLGIATRGGEGDSDDEGYDDHADDEAHEDDNDCHEGKSLDDEDHDVCKATDAKTAVCSRGGDHADYSDGDSASASDDVATCKGSDDDADDADDDSEDDEDEDEGDEDEDKDEGASTPSSPKSTDTSSP